MGFCGGWGLGGGGWGEFLLLFFVGFLWGFVVVDLGFGFFFNNSSFILNFNSLFNLTFHTNTLV